MPHPEVPRDARPRRMHGIFPGHTAFLPASLVNPSRRTGCRLGEPHAPISFAKLTKSKARDIVANMCVSPTRHPLHERRSPRCFRVSLALRSHRSCAKNSEGTASNLAVLFSAEASVPRISADYPVSLADNLLQKQRKQRRGRPDAAYDLICCHCARNEPTARAASPR